MKCLICGSDSAGEVCNKCSRLEKILYQKEWTSKEGMLLRKTEDFRIVVSNMRISGRVAVSDNNRGLNTRLDNISHYLLNITDCSQTTFQGKRTVMITIANHTGDNARYTIYCYLPGFEEADQLIAAIADGKQKAATLTERIRQTSGISSASAPAPAPTPVPKPVAGLAVSQKAARPTATSTICPASAA